MKKLWCYRRRRSVFTQKPTKKALFGFEVEADSMERMRKEEFLVKINFYSLTVLSASGLTQRW